MSSLAQILFDLGNKVQGSDIEEFIYTQEGLEKRNISIYPFSEESIKDNFIIIAGNSFNEDHIEIKRAKELNLPIHKYNEYLGELIHHFDSIAITGTHGKTSTTGLLAHVLNEVVPTNYLIGDGTGNANIIASSFVFEACEYRRHFLSYNPNLAIINNIDFDHPDYFDGIEDVRHAFESFSVNVKEMIFANGDDEQIRKMNANVPITYFGFGNHNDVIASNVKTGNSGLSFDVYINGEFYERFIINSYGKHSIMNTLAVIAVCHHKNIEPQYIKAALETHNGVKRRFSETKYKEQIIIDDYAHHPTEIRATIEAVKEKYPTKKVIAIFQPHTHSRTSKFLKEFATSLSLADSVYLCEIFNSARESKGGSNIEELKSKVHQSIILDETNINLLENHTNSVLLFMGAGDIQKYQTLYLKSISL